ncbi:LAFE_0E02300g1_1 [Lachancea fermentati]|uniref:LAFE_0E02300g1_1 n=1 Tax=Lachancea fermentati TaxID=4955 RepID=A0A1G4MCD6_LACFM|nr:LAFE_0E02300g1_1 [Lachancea fermentati]
MDRIKQLEEKKRKLQELRERRKYVNDSSSIISNDERIKTLLENVKVGGHRETISISTQTDDFEQPSSAAPSSVDVREVITYEKSVQTDFFDEEEPCTQITETEHQVIRDLEGEFETEKSDEDADNYAEDKLEVFPKEQSQTDKIVPLVYQDQGISVITKTFALSEVLEKSNAHLQDQNTTNGNNFDLRQILDPEFTGVGSKICSCIDVYSGFVMSIVQHNDKSETHSSSSYVYVYQFDSGKLLDAVEFQGQSLLKGEFLRNPSSKIVSIILTSYNGKTILYELRAVSYNDGPIKVERNIISKNYHNYPILALWQFHTRDARFLTASTDGSVREINAVDMSLYEEIGSHTTPFSFKLLPVSASDLMLDSPSSRGTSYDMFWDQLSRMSLYDEIAIVSLVTLPQDQTTLYVGCEDGGIYKITPQNDTDKHKTIRIALDNNGFMPTKASEFSYESKHQLASDNGTLFHSAPVSGLYRCGDLPNLLLSSGMDWKCILWDVTNNLNLATIELDHPIITCQWLSNGDNNLLMILTPSSLEAFEIHISSTHLGPNSLKWSVVNEPSLRFSLSIEQCASLDMFSWFKLLSSNKENFVVLGGDSPLNYCFKLFLD